MMYKRRVLRTLHWTKTSWTQRDRRCVTASQEGLEPPDPWTGEWVGALGWGQVSGGTELQSGEMERSGGGGDGCRPHGVCP